MSAKPTRIDKLLAFWATYLLVFSWLPLVRCVFDGETYRWGTSHFGFGFSAAGIGPDLWLLVVKSAVLFYLLWGLLRGSDPVHRVALVVWNVAWFADGLLGFIWNPDGMMFHGDTLDIHLNIGLLVPVVTGVFAALTVVWAIRWRPGSSPAPEWTPLNRRLLIACVALLPIQFVLLRFGGPHGTTDAIGVLLTIAQCPLIAAALYPWSPRSSS